MPWFDFSFFLKTFYGQHLDRLPCERRFFSNNGKDTGGDSFVCVCNSTYCDTIEPVDKTTSRAYYQEYITCKKMYRFEKFENKFDSSPSNGY
jgi:hypothetical protein